jgi:hypothetical protein
MIAAFIEHKRLTDEQVDEIQQMIDDYKFFDQGRK